MTNPKPGDRVRVSAFGDVVDMSWSAGVKIATDNGEPIIVPIYYFRDVEILPPREPDWQPGDLVLDAEGVAFRRDTDAWWVCIADSVNYRDRDMHHPLRRARIVPEDGAP